MKAAILTCLVLLVAIYTVETGVANPALTVLYFDDFESQASLSNIDGKAEVAGTMTNKAGPGPNTSIDSGSQTPGSVGASGLLIERISAASPSSALVEWAFPLQTAGFLSLDLWVKPIAATSNSHIIYLGQDSACNTETNSTNFGVQFNFTTGQIIVRTAGFPSVATFTPGAWYQIIFDVDIVNNLFGLWIKDASGTVIADLLNQPWDKPGTGLGYLTVQADGPAPSSFCLDDVRICHDATGPTSVESVSWSEIKRESGRQ